MPASTIVRSWFGLMAIGGFAFGLFGDRRPFGAGIFGHPLVVYFVIVGVALLVLRFALARPVPELIPDRMLLFGCAGGIAAFLVGNGLSAWLVVGA